MNYFERLERSQPDSLLLSLFQVAFSMLISVLLAGWGGWHLTIMWDWVAVDYMNLRPLRFVEASLLVYILRAVDGHWMVPREDLYYGERMASKVFAQILKPVLALFVLFILTSIHA